MKKLCLSLFCLCLVFASTAQAGDGRGCKAKEEAVQRQLEQARQYGNTNRVRGLERALANIRTWCTDDSLKSRAEMKVLDKEQEVFEREAELEEARQGGKPDKIAKRERKLQEARRELEQAKAARDRYSDSK